MPRVARTIFLTGTSPHNLHSFCLKTTSPSKQRTTLLSLKQPANHSVTDGSRGIIDLIKDIVTDTVKVKLTSVTQAGAYDLPFLFCFATRVSCEAAPHQPAGQASAQAEIFQKPERKLNFCLKFLSTEMIFVRTVLSNTNAGCNSGFRERTEPGQTRPT